jgi:hypothetical protein
MKKEFVTYEIALALKELKFDEPCFAHFVKHYNEIKCILDSDDFDEWWTNNSDNLECTAPLKQQAFRFFRDNYNLYSEITLDSYKEPYSLKVTIKHLDETNTFVDEEYYPYSNEIGDINNKKQEEAELACLIKLIEIVKSK